MKKFVQYILFLAVFALLGAVSCTKTIEYDTDQYSTEAVLLQAYGPQPVVRGGILRFVGSNLDKVSTVTIPGAGDITPEVTASGVHSEIRITVPKDGPEVGYPVLNLKDGSTITAKTPLSYSEPISIDSFMPASVLPGGSLTIDGDYLNLIHEVIFAEKVIVSENDFTTHTRYQIVVPVPAAARTGKVGLGTIDETVVADDELLASLNIVETDAQLVVQTATGDLSALVYKAGTDVVIRGKNLDLVKAVKLEGATVTDFTLSEDGLTFTLPASASDGEAFMVMESGVEVSAGTFTTMVPSRIKVSPAPVKNGAALTVSGDDLDLVSGIELPNAGWVDYEYGTDITIVVPENAQAGNIVLHMENGKTVEAAYTLVVPEVTGFSANPASAGSDVTIYGTDLDLVKSVSFAGADAVEVEAAEGEIVVAVPTAANTGAVVLNLKNGASVEALELAVDKPAGAYIASFPEDLYAPGDVFIVEIENADHLTGVQIDDVDVTYILSGSKLYVHIPANAKRGSAITLVSDNGSVTYTLNIDPGDIIEIVLYEGLVDNGNWQNWEVPSDTYTKAELKAGQTLRFYVTLKDTWWQMQFFDGHWGQMDVGFGNGYNVNAGIYDASEGFISVKLTEEMITLLTTYTDWGYSGILQWENLALEKITYYEDNSDGTELWSGLTEITWGDGGRVVIPASSLASVKAGSKLRLFYSQKQDTWAQAQINYGDWTGIDFTVEGISGTLVPTDVYGWFSDGILDRCTELTLTDGILENIQNKAGDFEGIMAGIIIQGSDLIFTKVTVK